RKKAYRWGFWPPPWPPWRGGLLSVLPALLFTSTGQPIENQNSATTVAAISAVPAQPNNVSIGRALKRPITDRRVTTTIMTAMIGTATMPLSTALQISIWMGSIGV